MKNISAFIVIILLMLLGMVTAGAQDATPTIWLSSDVTQVTAGQEFTVSVNVSGANQVYGTSFRLSFDPAAFEVVPVADKPVAPGAFFVDGPSFALTNTVNAQTGMIEYALTLTQPAQPVSGDGVVGAVTFRALAESPVTVSVLYASLVTPEFTEVDGRLVAQNIQQVPAAVTPSVVMSGSQPVGASVPSSSVSVGGSSAPSASVSVAGQEATAMFNSPALNNQPATVPAQAAAPGPQSDLALIVAGIFFVAGMVLLVMSVGMYAKMRVHMSLALEGEGAL